MQSLLFFILTKASWRIFAVKGGMSIFYILRVFSMGHDFFSKLDSTFPSFASNIYVILASFTLNFEYVVDETKSYLKCTLYFVSIFCWISPPILVPNKYYKSSLFIYLLLGDTYEIYVSLCDTYEIYVSPFDFVKIFIIYLLLFIIYYYSSSNLFAGYLKTE